MTAPMEGIRILEVAEHTFVPAASAVLSDWGAEVIKVEHVERGDAMRGLARTGVMDLGDGVHALLEHSNRGKKSLGVDLSQPEGLDVLYRLAKVSDVFLTNKLPRVLSNLSIDVEDIRAHNPSIIYVRGSGYGNRGPDANRGGYDILGYWCRSGLAVGGTPLEVDNLVSQPAPAYGDSIGAMTIAGGISAALLHRERTGHASVVDVSLLATGMWAGGAGIALSAQLGFPWKQFPATSETMRNPLTHGYTTSDDRIVFMSCLQGFAYWAGICEVVERPDLIDDPRFSSHEALAENAFEAVQLLQAEFVTKPLVHWYGRLEGFKGQWSVVQDNIEVRDDPQVEANGYIVETETKGGTTFPLVASPVQFDEQASQTSRAPEFNEHGDEILADLAGFDWDAIIDLKMKNVVA